MQKSTVKRQGERYAEAITVKITRRGAALPVLMTTPGSILLNRQPLQAMSLTRHYPRLTEAGQINGGTAVRLAAVTSPDNLLLQLTSFGPYQSRDNSVKKDF